MLVTLDDKSYVVGLEWSRIAGDDAKEEIKLISEETGAKYGLLRTISSESGAAIRQAGLSKDKKYLGKASAAALLADAIDQGVLLEPLEGDQVWLCAVVDHEILAGCDAVVPRSEASGHLSNLIYPLLDDMGDFPVYSSQGVAGLLGINDAIESDFSTLIGEASADKTHRIGRVGGYGAAPYLGIGLVVCAGIVYMLLSDSGHDAPQDLGIDFGTGIEEPVKRIVERGPSASEILARAREEEIAWLTEEFASQLPSVVVSGARRASLQSSRALSGYARTRTVWTDESASRVHMIWSRGVEGRLLGLRSGLSEAISVSPSRDNTQASSTHMLADAGRRDIDNIVSYLSEDPSASERFIDALSTFRFEWSVGEHDPGPRPKTIVGISDAEEAVTRQLVLPAMSVVVTGSSLARLEGFADLLSKHDSHVLIESIIIEDGAESSWTFTGVVYEAP